MCACVCVCEKCVKVRIGVQIGKSSFLYTRQDIFESGKMKHRETFDQEKVVVPFLRLIT